jgi:gluconate 2-dehydrogenase gamma chain
MSDIKRRKMLQILGATPAAAALTWTTGEAAQKAATPAAQTPAKPGAKPAARGAAKPKFFTAHEYATVTMLADIIIPKDERSGSASDAGVPAFIDYTLAETLADQPDRRVGIRGGLAWLDLECNRRFAQPFVKCTDAQRTELLDEIAWPKKAKPSMSHGVRFFNQFRDLVASGFWSSKVGVADLQYMGNVPVGEWTGSPPEAMQKVGVSYED